ncbi:MAG: response regulator transcription factor [Chitinophagales bacterium]|nr:response regulator transcription factor [Chitinophagales bacterium]
MKKNKANILLVEDDSNLSFVIKDNLERKEYQVSSCKDGLEALNLFAKQSFDILITDVMMPNMDGMVVVEKIRSKNQQIPIIFISAKSLLNDKLAAFKIGGDDYLIKPFSMDELIFKIEVFLKRSQTIPNVEIPQIIIIGKYKLDFANLALSINRVSITLTMREAEVLRYLAIKKNQLVQRGELLKQIWGSDDYFLGRSLDVFISRLRKYLKEDNEIEVENVHGVGFRLVIKE